MDRAPQRMDWDTIHSIIGQIKSFKDRISHINPFLTNEPFADSRMPQIIRLINSELPGIAIDFFTNGSLFSPKMIEEMQGCQVRSFNVSLHHSTKEDYEAELGINFEKTIASIHRLIDAGLGKVNILRVPASPDTEKNKRFTDFCRSEFPGVHASISYRYNWKGDIASFQDYASTLDIICPRHLSMTITVSGEVALCCLDQNADYSLGNIHKNSLLEIYNGEKAAKFRSQTKRHNQPCDHCNMVP